MRADDDGALLTAATRDVTAFESLYRRYVGQVTAYAVARCSTAADVVEPPDIPTGVRGISEAFEVAGNRG